LISVFSQKIAVASSNTNSFSTDQTRKLDGRKHVMSIFETQSHFSFPMPKQNSQNENRISNQIEFP